MKIHTPPILYGTAWKEEKTEDCVFQALNLGFEGIDTANQRKHYFEEGVGLAIQKCLKTGLKKRDELFLQTKFTSINGQDSRLPYNELDSLTDQVQQSFASSLKHLHTDYLDSYVLHGPTYNQGICPEDAEIWQAMESLVYEGKVKYLGISNVSIQQLDELYRNASIKPSFVQNRCFTARYWDQEVRSFCNKHNMIYQGFSLLTANVNYLSHPYLREMAINYSKSIPQIVFRFALHLGMLPLTGTTNSQHMKDDLDIHDFELSSEEIEFLENLVANFQS